MKLENLETKFVGKNIKYFETTESTQLIAWEDKKLNNGIIIIADYQTKGKGTHGRVWTKNVKEDLTFSIKINCNCEINKIKNLSYMIADILVQVLTSMYKININIKYPNDLVIKNKKIGGILVETKVSGSIVKELVIGVGINIEKQIFKKELINIATSIRNEFDVKIDRYKVLSKICNMVENELLKRKII